LPPVELLLVADGRIAVARALERRAVDVYAEPEREMAAEVGREERASVGDRREEAAQAAVAAATCREREDVEREPRRVDERMHRPDPASVVLEVAPVVEAGERRRHRAEDPDR
jgi:hypothetical protein